MNQIVEYARPRKLALARLAVSDLIIEALTLLGERLRAKHLTVQTSFAAASDSLLADRDQIVQVLLSVIDHALEDSPLGATIDITTNESCHHDQPGVMIRVRDAGTGLSVAGLSHVVGQISTSEKPQDAGLGMTVCKNIIERHRGDLHLTSTVGAGTIASIWLPVTQEFQRAPSDAVRADIFVTDDEPAIRGALVKRLMRQGHHAVGYDSGEALLAGLQHRLPDLILLDLKMPGLSGLETLKHVRQLAPAAIVIMLTAYGTMQDAVETMKLGAYDFMVKSVDLNGLDAVIAQALDVLKLRQHLADRTCDFPVWGLNRT
jgi:CheY-like chemotaxis protein